MVPRARSVLSAFAVIIVAASLGACGKSTPTTPTGAQPRIDSISPTALQPSASPQLVTFNGANFTASLTLVVTAPDGSTTTVTGSSLQSVTAGSFEASIVLAQAGTYSFVVDDTPSNRSSAFTVNVQAGGVTRPTIVSVTPNALPRTTQPTLVTLQGTNFSTTSTVTVIDPNGASTIIPTQSLALASATSIEFEVTFNLPGIYTISVTSPNGDMSNTVLVTVT